MKNISKNSIIARILAGEKIMLAVQENLSTASFDLKQRIIRIPDYMFDDEDFTMMVVAHEVGHCVYTPYNGWIDFKKKVEKDPTLSDEQKRYSKSALNILEDVRIDRLMRKKYPGLLKFYRNSCKFIYETDFFKIKAKNKQIDKMSFLNKICVFSKCDFFNTLHMYHVKFDQQEQDMVNRVYKAETFEEICDLTLEVLRKFKLEEVDNIDEHEENNEEEKTSPDQHSENGEKPKLDGRYNVDEEFMEEEGEGEVEENDSDISMGGLGGETQLLQDIWNSGIKAKANIAKSNSLYNKSGTKDIFEISEFKTVPFDERYGNVSNSPRTWNSFNRPQEVLKLENEYKGYVNSFASKFNQRKRARELVNNFEKDMGNIDPLKLHKYSYDDNIFQKKDIENYQKNHGFIFLIDCSSSMSDVFRTLTMQIFAFYKICERIDVPFAIYGYTDSYGYGGNFSKNNFGSNLKYYKFIRKGDNKNDIYDNVNKMISGQVAMGGTPTSDAVLGMVPEIKRFRDQFTPDILNLIVITDGSDGISMQSGSLSFKGGLYMNTTSPRGVVDNNAAIYSLLRDAYGVRIFHMDITNQVPDDLLSMDETDSFRQTGFLTKKEFGGANNVLWVKENIISSKSTKIIDSFVNILA